LYKTFSGIASINTCAQRILSSQKLYCCKFGLGIWLSLSKCISYLPQLREREISPSVGCFYYRNKY